MRPILLDAAARANRYLEELERRSVAPSSEAVNRLPDLGGPFPQDPTDPEGVLAALDAIGSPATVASAGGRYFGFVIGGALPAALAANWLAGAWDQNAGLWVSSPTCAVLEEIALRWLIDVLHLPEQSGGAFVTGTTMANFSALAAARHALLARAGWDVEADGLFGAPPITVIVGDEVHVSLLKALSLLGLGRDRVLRVPPDAQGRMRAEALPPLTDHTIVCAQAGNVNTGALDPVGEICAAAHDAAAWVHVNGAFGLWAAVSPALAHLVRGAEDADSWAVDAHKWLNTPYDGGVAFVRDAGHLTAAMSASAAYLPQDGRRDPMRYTPEVSRRARGVEIWAALRSLGRSGLADLIERTCRYARRFSEGLASAGYPSLNEVVLNQVLVSFGNDDNTRLVIDGIQADGTCWCGGTVWHGRAAMRISVSSWATTEQDIDRSLAAVLRVAARRRRS
ncbi:MAG TPA: pyridoxal-dependent decarboxylase [bacterium]|nr:pyridoxal-dependent decarboxylase [bacterium]